MREIVIGEEIKLIQEVPNIDTTQGVHPGEGQDTWEPVKNESLLGWLLN
jgi:hypothetical protein